jgi:hypothetical protein
MPAIWQFDDARPNPILPFVRLQSNGEIGQ